MSELKKTKIHGYILILLFIVMAMFTAPEKLGEMTGDTPAEVMIDTGGFAILFMVIYVVAYVVVMKRIFKLMDKK